MMARGRPDIGMLQSIARHCAKTALAHLSDKAYLAYLRLLLSTVFKHRFERVNASILGMRLSAPDICSFAFSFKEIFVDRVYAFNPSSPAPRIIDVGANVGLCSIFLKRLYPKAVISAYEADPVIFGYLERNLAACGFDDVELVNKAVWTTARKMCFRQNGCDGGRLSPENKGGGGVEVETVGINELLGEQPVDFLKIDIEGAELAVLRECAPEKLRGVANLFVEYHSRQGEPQGLSELLRILEDSGFRLNVQNLPNSSSPLLGPTLNDGFDMQLNIFAWRRLGGNGVA